MGLSFVVVGCWVGTFFYVTFSLFSFQRRATPVVIEGGPWYRDCIVCYRDVPGGINSSKSVSSLYFWLIGVCVSSGDIGSYRAFCVCVLFSPLAFGNAGSEWLLVGGGGWKREEEGPMIMPSPLWGWAVVGLRSVSPGAGGRFICVSNE